MKRSKHGEERRQNERDRKWELKKKNQTKQNMFVCSSVLHSQNKHRTLFNQNIVHNGSFCVTWTRVSLLCVLEIMKEKKFISKKFSLVCSDTEAQVLFCFDKNPRCNKCHCISPRFNLFSFCFILFFFSRIFARINFMFKWNQVIVMSFMLITEPSTSKWLFWWSSIVKALAMSIAKWRKANFIELHFMMMKMMMMLLLLLTTAENVR